MKLYGPLNLNRSELRNAITQNLGAEPGAPTAGLRYFDTALHFERYYNGTRWVDISDTVSAANVTGFDERVRTSRLDQMAAPTSFVSLNGQRLTGVAEPLAATDAATMGYVDAVAQGLQIKDSVIVASTENVELAGVVAVVDGVELYNGDRVLLKNQDNATENGIYEYTGATPTLVRAPDADSSAEIRPGMFCFVTEGAVNHDRGYVLTTDNPIELDVTELTFTQFSGSGTYTGTVDRIDVTGNQIDIASTYTGQATITTLGTITTGTWTANPVGVAYGGTGAATAADARTNLGTLSKYSTTFGNGVAVSYLITHNLATTAIGVELWETAGGQTVYADVHRTDANSVTVDGFTVAPGLDALSIAVWG